jgi:SAM-dependent methyltransferase
MNLIKRLWELPPQEVFLKIRKKLARRSGFDVDEILSSPKLMRAQRFQDFLSRYEAILSRTRGWTPIDFKDKTVIELGCGPMMGFGPIAIFRGAKAYVGIEPGTGTQALGSEELLETYYKGVYRDLKGIYGTERSFEDFKHDMREKISVISRPLMEVEMEKYADILISNSCLEHIAPFEQSIRALKKFCKPDCRLLNLVDFGSHRAGRSPFDNLYVGTRDDYLEKFGQHVNLMRGPDMIKAFHDAGFDVDLVPYTEMRDSYSGPVHDYWSSRFSEQELFLKTGILFGPASKFPKQSNVD